MQKIKEVNVVKANTKTGIAPSPRYGKIETKSLTEKQVLKWCHADPFLYFIYLCVYLDVKQLRAIFK